MNELIVYDESLRESVEDTRYKGDERF